MSDAVGGNLMLPQTLLMLAHPVRPVSSLVEPPRGMNVGAIDEDPMTAWWEASRRVPRLGVIGCTRRNGYDASAVTASLTRAMAESRSACADANEKRRQPSPRAPNARPSIAATP